MRKYKSIIDLHQFVINVSKYNFYKREIKIKVVAIFKRNRKSKFSRIKTYNLLLYITPHNKA